MRRPVGVKWIRSFFVGQGFSPARAATVATLPSALLDERFLVRSVQVGCSRCSRCCHLLVDLDFHPRWKSGQAIDAVTETRLWALVYFPSSEDFDFMLPPAALSGGCCATVRTLLHSPTSDAATPPTFAPSQSPLASSHSSRHARPASNPSAADHCPLQTDPKCGALPAPAECADTDRLPC